MNKPAKTSEQSQKDQDAWVAIGRAADDVIQGMKKKSLPDLPQTGKKGK